MKFNSKQILLVSIAAALVLTLFLMGYKTPFATNSAKGVTVASKQFDAEAFLSEQKSKLTPAQQELVKVLESDKNNKENLVKLANLWDSLNVTYGGAYYTYKLAEIEQNEITWFAAGSKFYNVANFSSDSLMGITAIQKAKEAYTKVTELNPKNLQAKNALAVCIIQGDNDVMKGVGMLKEVVATDSNNVQAIFTLGMLSIQSSQFDKARERFEKLIKIEPFNAEYYFYLAEVYAKGGNTQKAIKTYETCKTLVKDKEAKKEIETIINKLNKL
jgi:tetratricopeptide (TPR) repeat protein